MKLFPATAKTSGARRLLNNMLVGAVCVLTGISANSASADSTYTTVVRETVYHSPSRVVVSPRVFIPVNRSVYVGIGRGTVVSHQPRQTVIYREVTRHHDRHDEDYYRDSSYRQVSGYRREYDYHRVSDYHRENDYHRDKDYRAHPFWGNSDRGHGYGYRNKEPVRGRWSGSDRRRDVIYVEKDGRRNSSYRETERRSVEIRDRSR